MYDITLINSCQGLEKEKWIWENDRWEAIATDAMSHHRN
jgi:hypothetical protein